MAPGHRRQLSAFKDFLRGLRKRAGSQPAINGPYPETNGSIPEEVHAEPISESQEENVGNAPQTREYWGPTRDISPEALEALMKRHGDEITGGMWDPKYRFKAHLCGSFNNAYILESIVGCRVCVRVPACGWAERWTSLDADMLRATALGMKWMAEKSGLPVPKLLAYDDTMNNEVQAPYLIISYLNGHSVAHAWNAIDGEEPAAVEERRQNILRTLAATMCRLDKTRLPQAGMLWFPNGDDEPVVGNSWRLDTANIFAIKRLFHKFEAKASIREVLFGSKTKLRIQLDSGAKKPSPHHKGVLALWELMVEAFICSASVASGEPQFVLMQSDFNPQNILVDKSGNVTGIIDWDCLEAVPRQIGWCSTPHFLQRDWSSEYRWPGKTEYDLAPDGIIKYRNDYTRYIQARCGSQSDTIFTAKSHIYRALFGSAESLTEAQLFVHNVLSDILPRAWWPIKESLERIGTDGFQDDEKAWIEAQLKLYFAPDVPSALDAAEDQQQMIEASTIET